MAPSNRHARLGRPAHYEAPTFSSLDGEPWQQSARCRGLPPEVFFPEDRDSRRQRRAQEATAKQICATCPVMAACREHALRTHEKYGVWGALTARERLTCS
jgi:WhiB family redox-sensing transcriptional regulator